MIEKTVVFSPWRAYGKCEGFQPVVTMMEVIANYLTSLYGQNVPIILNSLEIEHVMIILKPNLNK